MHASVLRYSSSRKDTLSQSSPVTERRALLCLLGQYLIALPMSAWPVGPIVGVSPIDLVIDSRAILKTLTKPKELAVWTFTSVPAGNHYSSRAAHCSSISRIAFQTAICSRPFPLCGGTTAGKRTTLTMSFCTAYRTNSTVE